MRAFLFYDASGIVTCFQLILAAELKVPFLDLVHNYAAGHLKYTKCLHAACDAQSLVAALETGLIVVYTLLSQM